MKRRTSGRWRSKYALPFYVSHYKCQRIRYIVLMIKGTKKLKIGHGKTETQIGMFVHPPIYI